MVAVYGTCNANSHDEHTVLVRQCPPKYVHSAQYGCFLQLLAVVLSRYLAQTFSE